MSDEPDAYQTYVLRLWRAQCQGQWQWRASIESPHTGERQWFASLAQAFAYLNEQCDRQVPHTPEVPAPDARKEVLPGSNGYRPALDGAG